MFSMMVNDYWADERTKLPGTQPKEHPVMRKVRGCVVMMRGGVMNLVLATQRGDADIFPEGVRGWISTLSARGRHTRESARMVFGGATAGRGFPPHSRGVGTTSTTEG